MNIEAISIRNIKRYAAEHAGKAVWKEKSKYLPKTGKKICVVGGGPAGTAAAFQAARMGADVLIIEQMNCLGGIATAGWHGHICSYGPHDDVTKRIVSNKFSP